MKILFGIILITGVIFNILAIRQYNKSVYLLENGIKTKAKVIEIIEVESDNGYTYKPKFEYIDENGKHRIYTNSVSTNPPSYQVGDTEDLVYNPNDYNDAKVVTFTGLYLFSLIMGISGSVMMIIGIVYFMAERRKNRNRVKHIGEYQK